MVHFSEKLSRLSSTGSEILTFGSHCLANFQPILDCFVPKFKSEYNNLENIKTDCVNTVVFNLHEIKRLKFFLGHPACSVQRKTITFHFRKNKVQMIFEASENNIKILDILFSEKLQIT